MKVTDEMVERAARALDPDAGWDDTPGWPSIAKLNAKRQRLAKERARAALEAALPQWQPIETAPKAGWILLWRRSWAGIAMGYWSYDAEKWRTCNGTCPAHQPTHWMPLLPPPDVGEQKEGGR